MDHMKKEVVSNDDKKNETISESQEKTDESKKNYKGHRLSCLKKLSDHNKVLSDFNMPEYRKYFEENLHQENF